MTPRDWNEMKKLLGAVAGEDTAQEILSKVEQVVSITPITYASVASDNVLKTIISSTTSMSYNGVTFPTSATIKGFSGMLRIVVSLKAGNNSAKVWVKKNGTVVGTVDNTSTSFATKTLDIPVVSGDLLTFGGNSTAMGYDGYCNLLTVCGTVSAQTEFSYEVI